MKRKIVKSLVLLLLVSLVVGSFAAYAAKPVYPLKGAPTLKYWMELHSNIAAIAKNFGDTELAKELAKRTGVSCQYIHPAQGQVAEQFNLLMASGDLPDVVEYNWSSITGGPNAALKANYIIKLNDVWAKYSPNVLKLLKSDKRFDKYVKTDEGAYYNFPFFRGNFKDIRLLVTAGPIIRADWLKELKLNPPTTIDEWYVMLKAFKEKKGATYPLIVRASELSPTFAGGFNSFGNFYVEKNQVKYGVIESTRKAYFATMNKWFKEGLLDPNFAAADSKVVQTNILTGKAGAVYGSGGGGMGVWLKSMKGKPYDLTGAQFPAAKKNGTPKFSNVSVLYGGGNSAAITSKCKNVETAARLLDYNYSKEGYMLQNFGIEGVSYKMIDGYPTYTEKITKDPKLAMTQAMSRYMRGHTNGPFLQDVKYLEQYYENPQQKEAVKYWMKTEMVKYMMPPLTPTPAESTEYAKIMSDINTYVDEMTLKFIMGAEPIDNFDKFVAQIKKMGIDRAIAIQQAAYNRYQTRQ